MKYAVVGLGLAALLGAPFGCSGSASTAPSKPDSGVQPEAAGASDQDAGETGAGGAVDAGAEAGTEAGGSSDAGVAGDAGDSGPPQVCQPGALSCDGANVRVCNDSGTALTTQQTCSLSQTCSGGACLNIGCVPNTTFCSDGDVWSCGTDGTSSTLTVHCTSDQFCLENERVASCSATACFPGDPICNGKLATSCKPDGSGPKPGGDDCSLTGQTCYSGGCRDLVCTPGLKLCDNNSAYLCTDGGTARTLLNTCDASQSCDPSSGTCQTRICEPGKLSCDATRVVTCNPSGGGWIQTGPDCAATNSVCMAGACKPIVCPAGQYLCQDGDVHLCSADGTSSTLAQSCALYGGHCVSGNFYASCSGYLCAPSAAGCNGNVAATCSADGSAWMTGGTDCTQTNSICVAGKCMPKVCTSYTQFCADGNVQQCDYQGISPSLSKFCAYGTYCRAQASTADCVPTPCLPDNDGCASEKFGHCASDGMSVTSGATDCGAAAQVCTLQGCAASATDTIATSNQVGASTSYYTLFANVLEVESARKLTTIELYLSLPSTRTLVWVVYQKNFVNGYAEFDLKYQKTTTGTGTGFQSSGAISLELVAGKAYAIGVSASDGSFVYYYDTETTPPSLNFAHAVGALSASFAPSLNGYVTPGTLYYSRLTTTAP